MSKLEELINELCPDGVEYKELGEICNFKKGESITKKQLNEGDYPVIAGGRTPAYYIDKFNKSGETIAVSSSGAFAGFVSYWNIPVFISDAFTIEPKTDNLLVKYLFYSLVNKQQVIYSMQKGGGVPHVYSKDVARLVIPLPPLPVQQEIVRILDKFTELTAELTAELEARKKQYEYYREKLLTFDLSLLSENQMSKLIRELCPDGVEYKKLGDIIFETKERNKQCIYDKVYSVTNNGILVPTSEYFDRQITSEDTSNYKVVHNGMFVYNPSRINIGSIAWLKENEPVIVSPMYIVFGINIEKVSQEYLMYYLRSNVGIHKINNKVEPGARFRLPIESLSKITIPLPPLLVQQEIVRILDKFTELTAELTAELEARKKQYEYYRDKLLSFKPLPSKN
ncbi:restriction endonuclease subunit S [Anaerobranca gottschalkii]|uniref:Type I restriction enzyme, S subunit n=1 Tax=Anaerobranca gottschalkii DSM 13577 TaxID=1120990 RepID=A0A1H9YJQ9_9FIRM|nr:restriction endonuclease subunit S [Anaerobranca gottschalkii]SES69279.1 type I restriction enzyme, S subunit [Anaerobranca gottschalkii DSM 13577]